jgi:hypothetical protein
VAKAKEEGAHYEQHSKNFNIGNITQLRPCLYRIFGGPAEREVIEACFKNMKREDALATADYLKSIPPIKNKLK